MNAKTARDRMEAIIATRTTAQLFADMVELDTHRNAGGFLPLEEERIVNSAIIEVIEKRHGLTAALDAIYEDDDWTGTSRDALRLAMASA